MRLLRWHRRVVPAGEKKSIEDLEIGLQCLDVVGIDGGREHAMRLSKIRPPDNYGAFDT